MPNFDFVTERLATGGDLHWREDRALADLAGLVAAGITHIVDCRMEWNDEALVARHAPGVAYLHADVDDIGGRQPDWFFDRGVAFALDALAADPAAKVLVHCHMGINRGPSLAYAVLLAQDIDPVDALDAIRAARPIAAVGYAEDALAWHHRRRGTDEFTRRADRRRLRAWRAADTLDVAATIRGIRAAEGTELR
ncbi:MAG: dual specificity protein phosphatase family protein [Acidimicrobiia bacterium]